MTLIEIKQLAGSTIQVTLDEQACLAELDFDASGNPFLHWPAGCVPN